MSLFRRLGRRIHGPRCHLEPVEKGWVERRLLWLKAQFGSDPIRRPLVDASSRLVPTDWDGSYDAGAELFGRLCEFMRVDPNRLQLEFYDPFEVRETQSDYAGDSQSSGPAGLYHEPEQGKKLIIALDESGLAHPYTLAATICHELAHVHLLADRRIKREEEDCEPLTDLLVVYFGAGILNANAAFQFGQWQNGTRQGWSASRLGYLTEALFGYSLASVAWFRGETKPKWQRYLRENIEYYFDESMHFLSTTRDTTIPFDGA